MKIGTYLAIDKRTENVYTIWYRYPDRKFGQEKKLMVETTSSDVATIASEINRLIEDVEKQIEEEIKIDRGEEANQWESRKLTRE